MPIDLAILRFFNVTLSTPVLDKLFIYICDFGIWAWPLAVVIIALLWKGNAKERWMVLLVIVAVAIIDPAIYRILKPLFGRLRPCHNQMLDWVIPVGGCGGKYSFPSSHAANLFGVAVVAGSFYKRARYYLYPLAVMVSIGRIYLGVHYPSDTVAGAVFGAAIGIALVYIAKRYFPGSIGKALITKKAGDETESN